MLKKNRPRPDQLDASRERDAKVSKLIKKPVARWPEFEPEWDCDAASYRRAEDGAMSAADFAAKYSGGVTCCDVLIADLDAVLTTGSRRSKDEAWGFNDRKVAGVILFWSEGGTMTPPLISVGRWSGKDEIHIVGGNNRLAVLRSKGVVETKILVQTPQLDVAKALMPSLR